MAMIYFQQCDNTTWGQLYAVASEADLGRFLRAYIASFQRKHLQLPVEGMDYRILRGARATEVLAEPVGAEPSPLGLRYRQVAGVLDGIREAMGVDPAGFELTSIPGRMRLMRDAMERIRALALAALYPGQGKGQALAAIESIAHQAMQRGYEAPPEGIKMWMDEVEDVAVTMVEDGYWPPSHASPAAVSQETAAMGG